MQPGAVALNASTAAGPVSRWPSPLLRTDDALVLLVYTLVECIGWHVRTKDGAPNARWCDYAGMGIIFISYTPEAFGASAETRILIDILHATVLPTPFQKVGTVVAYCRAWLHEEEPSGFIFRRCRLVWQCAST